MTAAPLLAASPPPRRAFRDSCDTVFGGVASGLARHLGRQPLTVRAVFVALAALGGLGIALYGGLWMVLPSDAHFQRDAPGLESASRTGKRPAASAD